MCLKTYGIDGRYGFRKCCGDLVHGTVAYDIFLPGIAVIILILGLYIGGGGGSDGIKIIKIDLYHKKKINESSKVATT